jgi:hypothetical protein
MCSGSFVITLEEFCRNICSLNVFSRQKRASKDFKQCFDSCFRTTRFFSV